MKEITITQEPSKRIVALADEFSEYDLKDLEKINFSLFVYSYEGGSYDGSGFSVGKIGDKWFYHELGHCSCNGPTDGVDTSSNVLHDLNQIEELVEKNYSYSNHAGEVLKWIKENV